MASRIISGKDKIKESYYWTIILTKKDAIEMAEEKYSMFKNGINLIEEALKDDES